MDRIIFLCMVYLVEQVSAFLVLLGLLCVYRFFGQLMNIEKRSSTSFSMFDLIAKLTMIGRSKTKPCISWTALV